MEKKAISFYEIVQNPPYRLPELNETEEAIFDSLNEEGAASVKAIVRGLPQYKAFAIREALDALLNKNLVEFRIVTIEHDE